MTTRTNLSTHCVVRDSSSSESRSGLKDCSIVDSVQKLMALGLSAGEIKELGMAEGVLDAMCEYARLDEIASGAKPTEIVSKALRTLADETRKVDLELEMLGLRKRALTKRAKLLHKLEAMLQEGGD